MKSQLIFILSLLTAVTAMAQVNVDGVVLDRNTDETLIGASVIVKGNDGKIKKFATTKADVAIGDRM